MSNRNSCVFFTAKKNEKSRKKGASSTSTGGCGGLAEAAGKVRKGKPSGPGQHTHQSRTTPAPRWGTAKLRTLARDRCTLRLWLLREGLLQGFAGLVQDFCKGFAKEFPAGGDWRELADSNIQRMFVKTLLLLREGLPRVLLDLVLDFGKGFVKSFLRVGSPRVSLKTFCLDLARLLLQIFSRKFPQNASRKPPGGSPRPPRIVPENLQAGSRNHFDN